MIRFTGKDTPDYKNTKGGMSAFRQKRVTLHLTRIFPQVTGGCVDIRKLLSTMDSGGGAMRVTVERIGPEHEEEIIVRCHEPDADWVEAVREAVSGQRMVSGWQEGTLRRLKLSEIFYFEVVDDRSYVYTQAEVFEAKEKLYEFERLCAGSALFRCSKSMVLNADKIDYVRPSLSGRFEAVLSNGEKVVVSRKYVADLKHMLGV